MKRASGILLPVSSLPSRYGIGCFSKEAYTWIDQLKEAGQSYWQILPLSPTGYGDSPYQSFSSYAGNPYFVDLEALIEEGLLTREECDEIIFAGHPNYVDYDKQYEHRFELLKRAYKRSHISGNPAFWAFCEENRYWLEDYALYMAVKERFDGACWIDWAEDIKKRWDFAMDYYKTECRREIEFYMYIQYLFRKQWAKLKSYANENDIEIVGDIPIYVSFDSADAWANPELFQFDEEFKPCAVAGCPPDAFSEDGQLWGNPLYQWDYHKQTGYDWWCKRIENSFKLYDVVRVDHFRGFDEYYSIPYGDETAVNGHWEKGPGIELFRTIEERLGKKQIIAEDLGLITDTVRELLKESGYPGMKVVQFAFQPGQDNDYLPHNYDRNSVVYTGTHDNETLVQWYWGLREEEQEWIAEYMGYPSTPDELKYWDFVRMAMMSSANTCIIPVQDYLGLDKEARINFPSTLGDNWKWRISSDMLPEELINRIHALTKLSFRLPKEEEIQDVEIEEKEESEKSVE